MKPFGKQPHLGWMTALLLGAIVAVNVAGVSGIAVARRGAREAAERLLQAEAQARARAIASTLAEARADLAFLAGSPAVVGLAREPQRASPGGDRRAWDAAGAALILFLRGHPEVAGVRVRSGNGGSLVEAGRPRGIPGYWIPAGESASTVSPPFDLPRAAFPIVSADGWSAEPPRLEATIDPRELVERPRDEGSTTCALLDAAGVRIAVQPGYETAIAGDERPDGALAAVVSEGFDARESWRLHCVREGGLAVALVEPLVSRYRFTIVLDLALMGLGVVLGFVALQQSRRRQALEARQREETRVRELERQLFHAERLSTAGRLAAGMAHEINNPLEGLSNYLRLAQDALERGDLGAARRYLDGAGEGMRRTVEIVRRVLDHADPAWRPSEAIHLEEVLGRAVEFIRGRADFRHLRFETDFEPPAAHVRGSAVALGQVFLNLVLNACEAQPAGGEVRVRTRRAGGEAVVEIADRGPGVPAAMRERIFEPFQSTKQSAGLGLSICHAIVRQHRGELEVDDREGGGAVFRVRLPEVPAPSVPAPRPADA